MKYTPSLASFLSSAALLTVIGLLFVYSSSAVYALAHAHASDYYFKKQCAGAALGLLGALIIALLPIRIIRAFTPIIFWTLCIATVLTMTPLGVTVRGSRRWLSLAGFVFQPSEFLKGATVLYTAYLADRFFDRRFSFVKSTLSIMGISGLVAVILLLQPDFGQAVALMLTSVAQLFVVGYPLRHFVFLGAPLVSAAIGLVIIKPYRLARIMTYLNPWRDPQGAGFQIIQSLIALGSGKFFGVGLGQSIQKQLYLPMQHTDFIFSIIAEETGLFGATVILLLYGIFLLSGMRCALACSQRYGAAIIFGVVFLISVQASINIGVVTGLLPTKGIGLPFLSYGLSSLVANLLLCGVVTAVVLDDSPSQ